MSDNGFTNLGLDMDEPQMVERVRDLVYASAIVDGLRSERLLRGLTLEEVAERMGISVESVIEFEKPGSAPRLSTIRRYCMAVEVVMESYVRPLPKEEK